MAGLDYRVFARERGTKGPSEHSVQADSLGPLVKDIWK